MPQPILIKPVMHFKEEAAAAAPGAPSFTPTTDSIAFDGVDVPAEYMHSFQTHNLGIANAFTVIIWVKVTQDGFGTVNRGAFWETRASGSLANLIRLYRWNGNAGNDGDETRIMMWDSSAGLKKDYYYDDALRVNVGGAGLTWGKWCMLSLTWDGTNFDLWKNGVKQVAASKASDSLATCTDAGDRGSAIGASFATPNATEQTDFECGVWDSVLTGAEMLYLENGGSQGDANGNAIDWSADGGAYASSANLQHWWRLANDDTDMGADSGVAADLIDIMEDAANITAGDDIVADSPEN